MSPTASYLNLSARSDILAVGFRNPSISGSLAPKHHFKIDDSLNHEVFYNEIFNIHFSFNLNKFTEIECHLHFWFTKGDIIRLIPEIN